MSTEREKSPRSNNGRPPVAMSATSQTAHIRHQSLQETCEGSVELRERLLGGLRQSSLWPSPGATGGIVMRRRSQHICSLKGDQRKKMNRAGG